MPVIDDEACTGCQACVDACGPGSLTMSDNGKAILTHPETCGSEEHCIAPCPERCIRMEWLPWTGNVNRGIWAERT